MDELITQMNNMHICDERNLNYIDSTKIIPRSYEFRGIYESSSRMEIEESNSLVVTTQAAATTRSVATTKKLKRKQPAPATHPRKNAYHPDPQTSLQVANITSASRKEKHEQNFYHKNMKNSAVSVAEMNAFSVNVAASSKNLVSSTSDIIMKKNIPNIQFA